ncbi:MAG: signal recognition particle-docking protein FtsY [Synergistaceae bacterium]|nr:signal recognition particle-docking protein FtsY [Synergistaceae bacterium]
MPIWKNLTEKIKKTSNKWAQGISNLFSDEPITEEFWDELEEQLILGDVGIDTAEVLIEKLKQTAIDGRIGRASELRAKFKEILIEMLESVPGMGKPLDLEHRPAVVIMIGVNGSGKTTTAGKLAAQLKNSGIKVIMAAADTFRAAAIEQLKAWGERSGVRVVAQNQYSDAAAVVFDAIMAAKAAGDDVVIADTAGRLHTKSNLMEELSKVYRVVKRELPEGPAEVLIVLDSVTGQNSFIQAETFSNAMPITGVILTKYDNTSKGGIILAIAEKLKLPIRYVGVGEGVDDLQLFDPRTFVETLLDAGNTE